MLALGVTAAAVKVDGHSLSLLDHTPNYLAQEFGYTVDANGTTAILLPQGWKELTITKGDPEYKPLSLYGSMGGMDTLFDGNFATNFHVGSDLMVEFDDVTELDRLVLRWAGAYYDSYDIEYSEDGENWYTILTNEQSNNTVENGCGSIDDVRFGAIKAKYLRFVMVSRGEVIGIPALYELEAYAPVDLSKMTILPEEEDPSLDEDEWEDDEWYEEEEIPVGDEDDDDDNDKDDDEDDDDAQTETVRKRRRRVVIGLPTWLLILIIVAGVLLIGGLILLLLLLKKKKKKKEALEAAEAVGDTEPDTDFPGQQ